MREGLFPDSHNAFQMHQIMDLVSSIVSKQKMMSCRGIGGSGTDGGGGAGSLTGNGNYFIMQLVIYGVYSLLLLIFRQPIVR